MVGTIVNTAAICVGTLLGQTVFRRITRDWHRSALQSVGLGVVFIGASTALDAFRHWAIQLVLALVVGNLVGEALRIEDRLQALERRGPGAGSGDDEREGGLAKGFLAATLLFAVGPMAILGGIQDGLGPQPTILFTKSALDGLSAIVLSATLGIGVIFAALPVLAIQGGAALLAAQLAPVMTPDIVAAISGVGGTLITAIGLNMLGATRVRVAALLPAIVLAPLGVWLTHALGWG
ncbi:MAG: DUF554 domain-containing protein [Firmicutes bacterium]|nr:DUF554 domain-containing protein [Bacillota bacterium]